MTTCTHTAEDQGATVDPGCDLHTHSDLTDGRDTPQAMADAAGAVGLHTWGLSDHVRADSDWVIDYVYMVRGLRVDGLRIRCGVEAKILDAGGRLDLPASLPGLDYVLIADHQFPSPDGPLHPREVARLLGRSDLSAGDVVEQLVNATCAAVRRAPARPIVVHPFSLLPKMGLSESDVDDDHVQALAAACCAAGAAVEINEKWRCPSESVISRLREHGVELVAGSDAHRREDVGVWTYVSDVGRSSTVRPIHEAGRRTPHPATAP